MTPEMRDFVSTFQQAYVNPILRDLSYPRLSYPWTEELESQTMAECLSTLLVEPKDDGFRISYSFVGHPVSADYSEKNLNTAMEHYILDLYTYLGIPKYIHHFPSYANTQKLRNGLFLLLKFLKPFKYV